MVSLVGFNVFVAQAAVGVHAQCGLGRDQEVSDNIITLIVNVLITVDLDEMNIFLWNISILQIKSGKPDEISIIKELITFKTYTLTTITRPNTGTKAAQHVLSNLKIH